MYPCRFVDECPTPLSPQGLFTRERGKGWRNARCARTNLLPGLEWQNHEADDTREGFAEERRSYLTAGPKHKRKLLDQAPELPCLLARIKDTQNQTINATIR